LVESCDVYFYQIGQRLGIQRIEKYAKRFGFGTPTGIGLDGEKPGLVPSEAWKRKRFDEPWYEGETLMASIGQGFVLVTPIQLLNMISTIASGGMRWVPRIVERIESLDGRLVMDNPPLLKASLDLSPTTLQLIPTALRDVVMTRSGTGTRARLDGIEVAGKTGTAQVVQMGEERKKDEAVPRERRDHAWFACYAPAENPEIAVVVLVEHGGHGGASAAPIAREILRTYFTNRHTLKENKQIARTAYQPSRHEDIPSDHHSRMDIYGTNP
jgi:penicillin-binding protein 2